MSKKTTIMLIFLLMSSVGAIKAQKMLLKAEEMAQNGSLQEAILTFEKYILDNPTDYSAMNKLAEVYTQNGQFGQSIYWYNSVPSSLTMPVGFYLGFGNTLKRVGRYNEAIDVFGKLAIVDPILGDEMMASTDFAINKLTSAATYDLEVLPSNSNASDFGLTFYKNIPVFSSFRNDILLDENQMKFNKNEPCQRTYTYFASKKKLTFVNGQNGQINRVGPMSFTADGNICGMIESKLEDNLTFDYTNKTAALYLAKINSSGEIISTIPFEHNEAISSINSACLAFDGSAVYFSSNRIGGLGGFDIYVSYFDNDKWSLPTNMGSSINTSGDEITPFFINDKLYYSSNRGMNLGGFDVFVSNAVGGVWSLGENMGNGINSMGDDYFPVIDSKSDLYVTSNRLGGKGKHDIYRAIKVKVVQQEIVDADIPKAVNLEELEQNIAKHTVSGDASTTLVSNKEINPVILNPAKNAKSVVEPTSNAKAANVATTDNNPKLSTNTNQLEVTTSNNNPVDNKSILKTGKSEVVTAPTSKGNDKLESKTTAPVEKASVLRAETASATALTMAGARRTGLEKAIPRTEVFFIQLASISASKPNFTKFKSLVKFGNIYKMINNKVIKVRLGYFDSKQEAETILSKVKTSGYADAFITYEILNTAQMELVLASTDDKNFTDKGNFNTKSTDPELRNFKNGTSKYKIRLASYEDPTWFDLEKVRDLGRVEQWTKGSWTIFVLAGYNNIEEAKAAALSANNRGFKTAEVVIDNGGILERLKQN